MSLQTWLPLNGNINNYGLNGTLPVIVRPENMSYSNDGKLGKCALFSIGQNGWGAEITALGKSTLNFSICAWFCPTISATNLTFFSQVGGFRIFISPSNKRLSLSRQATTGGVAINLPDDFVLNTWHHICVVINYTEFKFYCYCNGIKLNEGNLTSNLTIDDPSSVSSYFSIGEDNGQILRGKVNDVRYYDHCLSVTEVHQIYQGLFLHYKLDTFDNDKIIDVSGYRNDGYVDYENLNNHDNTFTLLNDTPKYNQSLQFNGLSSRIINNTIPTELEAFTVNFWVKSSNRQGTTTVVTGKNYFAYVSGSGSTVTLTIGITCNNISTNTPATLQCQISSTTFLYDTWYMITICCKDNEQLDIYINGDLYSTRSLSEYNLVSGTQIIHNLQLGSKVIQNSNMSISTYYNFLGQLSDFRLYATFLSENDVKELYHTSAKIDNQGNFYTREFVTGTAQTVDLASLTPNVNVINMNYKNGSGSVTSSTYTYTNVTYYTGGTGSSAVRCTLAITFPASTKIFSNTFPLSTQKKYSYQIPAATIKSTTRSYSKRWNTGTSTSTKYWYFGGVRYVVYFYDVNDTKIGSHTLLSRIRSGNSSPSTTTQAFSVSTPTHHPTLDNVHHGRLVTWYVNAPTYAANTVTGATLSPIKSIDIPDDVYPMSIYKNGIGEFGDIQESDEITICSIKNDGTLLTHGLIEF